MGNIIYIDKYNNIPPVDWEEYLGGFRKLGSNIWIKILWKSFVVVCLEKNRHVED